MDCRTLNEKTYNSIQEILDKSKEEAIAPQTYYKSFYSPGTLINDWFENTVEKEKNETKGEPPLSETMDQYRRPCETTFPERKEYFNMIFDSYGYGQELLLDHLGFSYYGNFVSTYDLCYNHLTKGICGPFPRRYYKGGGYKPTTDLTLIYGNLTQWGLKERVYEKIQHGLCKEEIPTTEQRAMYKRYDLVELAKANSSPSFKRRKIVY